MGEFTLKAIHHEKRYNRDNQHKNENPISSDKKHYERNYKIGMLRNYNKECKKEIKCITEEM